MGTLALATAGYALLGRLGERLAEASGSTVVPDRALLLGTAPITDVVAGYDAAAVAAYRDVVLLDTVVPVASALALALALARTWRPWRRRWPRPFTVVALGALVALPADWLENVLVLAAAQPGPDVPAALAWTATAASAVKWTAVLSGYAALVVGLGARALRRARSHGGDPSVRPST